jgi:hypothetical protein
MGLKSSDILRGVHTYWVSTRRRSADLKSLPGFSLFFAGIFAMDTRKVLPFAAPRNELLLVVLNQVIERLM